MREQCQFAELLFSLPGLVQRSVSVEQQVPHELQTPDALHAGKTGPANILRGDFRHKLGREEPFIKDFVHIPMSRAVFRQDADGPSIPTPPITGV